VHWLANRLLLKQELAADADEFAGVELAQADAAKRRARKEKRKINGAKSTVRRKKNASFDLTYVPDTTHMLYGMRPASMTAVEGFQPLVSLFEQNIGLKATGIELNQIDQFMVLAFASNAEQPFGREPVLAVKTTKPVSFDKFIAWMAGGRAMEERELAGRKYSVNTSRRAFYTPDDRNLLYGSEDAIRSLIEQAKDGTGSPKWSKQFESVSTSQLCFTLDMEAVQSLMKQGALPRSSGSESRSRRIFAVVGKDNRDGGGR